jgi:hypothetical protein
LVEALFVGVAATALTEGVKFLYQQAGEVLSSWRQRRRNPDAPPPRVVEAPDAVTVPDPRPLPEPVNEEMLETLQELKDLAEAIKDGAVDPGSPEARLTVASLRDLLEVALRSPITFEGEAPRTVDVTNVEVTVDRVRGRVTGLRADLAKLQGGASFRDVTVRAGDVEAEGDVAGVDLS